tara:strand:+ start:63 stop:602 length:540 start_codon:yes stop_codon:yes gene_type:complete
MAAVKWNQDINAGQDWLANINLLKADATGRDITNHTIESKVKRHYKSASHKAVLTITVIDEATGNVSLGLSAAQTAILKNGKWIYDVELTAPPKLTVKDATGTFGAGELITGATSGATGLVLTHTDTNATITYTITSGTFAGTETINGTTFNATLVTNHGQLKDRVIEGYVTIRPEVTD